MEASPLGRRLLEQMEMGIQNDQTNIDVRDPRRQTPATDPRLLYNPRGDGLLVDRATGLLRPDGSAFDETYVDTLISYESLLENNADYKFANETAGLVNISTYAFISEDSRRQFQMVSQNIRDALIHARQQRSVSIQTRQKLIDTLTDQQAELHSVIVRLKAIYDSVAPTVKRWYWLGSMTGYMPIPSLTEDKDIRKLAGDATAVVPFWLLTRYIRQQYQDLDHIEGKDDWKYWEVFEPPKYDWCMRILNVYDTLLNGVQTSTAAQNEVSNKIYLTLRDVVVSAGIRLKPPMTPQKPTQNAALEVDRYAWLQKLPPNSYMGRYQSLLYYIEQTRTRVVTLQSYESIKTSAITADEARRVKPAEVSLANEPAILSRAVSYAVERNYFHLKCMKLLDIHLSTRNFNNLRSTNRTVANAFDDWSRSVDLLSNSLGGLSPDGFAHWINLLDTVLVPMDKHDGGRFLAPLLFNKILTPNPKPTPNNDSHDKYLKWTIVESDDSAFNMLSYLLAWQDRFGEIGVEEFLQRNDASALYCVSTHKNSIFETTLKVATNAIANRYLKFVIMDLGTEVVEEWMELNKRAIKLAQRVQEATKNPNDSMCVSSSLDLVTVSLVVWSLLLRDADFSTTLLKALKDEIYRHDDFDRMAANMKLTDYAVVLTSTIDPLLKEFNQLGNLAAEFYKELFRSTFLSPYDRSRIKASAKLTAKKDALKIGDIDPANEMTRAKSGNETVFTETWETLYANLFADYDHEANGGELPMYWRQRMEGFVSDSARTLQQKPLVSIFSILWENILLKGSYLPALFVAQGGVPPVEQLELATFPEDPIPPLPPPPPQPAPRHTEAIAESHFFQSLVLAFHKQWSTTIVPTELYDGVSERIPPMNLLHAMLIYVIAYYPRAQVRLRQRQNDLTESLRDAHNMLRAIAADDHNYANREVSSLLTDLYIPEQRWHMQAILTGRLVFASIFTSALHLAYRKLQHLANKTDGNARNGNGKRFRVPMLDYSHFKNVPLDILTAYTGPPPPPLPPASKSQPPPPATNVRSYIDTTQTDSNVIAQLRTSMAALTAQCIFQIRLDAPDQYKTTTQYQRAPVGLQQALHDMLPFRFRQLSAHAWQVFLV